MVTDVFKCQKRTSVSPVPLESGLQVASFSEPNPSPLKEQLNTPVPSIFLVIS